MNLRNTFLKAKDAFKMERYEKVFFCGVSNSDDLKVVLNYDIGGVLLYPSVFEDPSEFAEIMCNLEGKKLLVSTDHEGGQLEILPFIPQSPGNLLFGQTNPDFVFRYCNLSGKFMKELGINMIFAPVLDLKFPETNPVIGYRSYGSDPKKVSEFGLFAINGYKAAGLLSCAKHFPGHGRTRQDSHQEIAVVDIDREELDKDLYPFMIAVQNGVDSIMMAHVIYSKIDEKPASISRRFINSMLRNELQYDGLIISDAVEMKSLSRHYSPEDILVDFFSSRGDMLIISRPRTLRIYVEMLHKLIKNGKLEKTFLAESMQRIEKISPTIEDNYGFIRHAIEEAVEFHIEQLRSEQAVLVLPDLTFYSKADVSERYLEFFKKQAKRFLKAKIIPFSEINSVSGNVLIIDLLIDASDKEIVAHRKLSENFETVHIITRNPFLKTYFCDRNYIVTYSLSPIVMGYVFKKISRFLKGGV